ncbi:MAG: sterol desaturase/sphingolipid hydroxylase (fatty acid hydroxylase superfamily) [Myxococcota bacterium]|jgi:sterol desaturase/sphingolipid hydroxylase (fatty acid hydroxylase superfamily)
MLFFAIAFASALVVGTFVEYWGHRLMHTGGILKRRHARHHRMGSGQGFLGEFRDYALPTLAIVWMGFLVSPAAGFGFLIGDLMYAAVAAWSHQLQHEHPHKVWWMAQPQHSVHHHHQEWHTNFGMTTDIWDKVFRTYRRHELLPDIGRSDARAWSIHWASVSEPLPVRKRRS